MTALTDLPNEAIYLIIEHIERERDISSLCRTSRDVYRVADPWFYRLHVRRFDGWALFWAAEYDRVDTAKKLIAAGADAGTGFPLWGPDCPIALIAVAARFGSSQMTRFLFTFETVDPNEMGCYGIPPVVCAARHEDVVKLYMENPRVDINKEMVNQAYGLRENVLLVAVSAGRAEVVQLLLRDGRIDPSASDHNKRAAVTEAVMENLDTNVAVLRLLLADKRVNVNHVDSTGRTPLHTAAEKGHVRHVGALLEAGAEVNARGPGGSTPLHLCDPYPTSRGVLNLLLTAPGINPNAADDEGETPLMKAAHDNSMMIVSRLLRDERVLVNLTNNWGLSALYQAAQQGAYKPLRALLARPDTDVMLGADIGRYVLHAAMEKGDYQTAEALISDERLDPLTKDRSGWTPMICAAAYGRHDIVRLLWKRGRFSLYDRDTDGNDAMWYARQYKETVDVLLEIQAEVDGLRWDVRDDQEQGDNTAHAPSAPPLQE